MSFSHPASMLLYTPGEHDGDSVIVRQGTDRATPAQTPDAWRVRLVPTPNAVIRGTYRPPVKP